MVRIPAVGDRQTVRARLVLWGSRSGVGRRGFLRRLDLDQGSDLIIGLVDEMMSIGEFSSRCGLSPNVLRSYAEAGVLDPAAVDPAAGLVPADYAWTVVVESFEWRQEPCTCPAASTTGAICSRTRRLRDGHAADLSRGRRRAHQ